MNLDKLVEQYVSAWNRKDTDDLLALMHEGVAYYNAFWMESSVGQDVTQYLRDRLDEEKYWYQQVGGVIVCDDGVAYRYNAHELKDAAIGRALFNGAEVLNIRDGKIITVTDIYCDPDPTALKEVAKLTARRHGLPKYVTSGLRAV